VKMSCTYRYFRIKQNIKIDFVKNLMSVKMFTVPKSDDILKKKIIEKKKDSWQKNIKS